MKNVDFITLFSSEKWFDMLVFSDHNSVFVVPLNKVDRLRIYKDFK